MPNIKLSSWLIVEGRLSRHSNYHGDVYIDIVVSHPIKKHELCCTTPQTRMDVAWHWITLCKINTFFLDVRSLMLFGDTRKQQYHRKCWPKWEIIKYSYAIHLRHQPKAISSPADLKLQHKMLDSNYPSSGEKIVCSPNITNGYYLHKSP